MGYWVVGIPLEYLLAFVLDKGLIGLWMGMTIGIICHICFMTYIVEWGDWKEAALTAKNRACKEGKLICQPDREMPLI